MTQTAEPPVSAEQRPTNPALIVAVACYCGIVVALTQTMIVPLIPLLPTLLGASASDTSWAVTATLLTAAVTMPISGRLGDMVGKRLMLVISLGFLVAGSLLCAVSDSLIPVIAGRALQGMAMGAIALGISIMRDELPVEKVGPAVARVSATLGVGGAIGLPVSALIVEKANWHALFYIAAGLGVLGILAVLTLVPESKVRTPARFDFLGAFGLASALVMLLLAISKGGDWGWTSSLTLGLLVGSASVFAVWGRWELRSAAPLVDLRTTARPQVLFTNIASIGAGFAMYGMSLIPIQILLAPQAVGHGLGLTLIQAGLVLMPGGFAMYFFSDVGARITAARGPRAALTTGIAIIAVGYAVLLFFRAEWWQVSLAGIVTSAGVGVAYAAMPALIMGAVAIKETAAANGLNALMRSVGTSLSAAVIGTVLAHETVGLGGVELPSGRGLTLAILISLAASAVALLLTLAIPRKTDDRP